MAPIKSKGNILCERRSFSGVLSFSEKKQNTYRKKLQISKLILGEAALQYCTAAFYFGNSGRVTFSALEDSVLRKASSCATSRSDNSSILTIPDFSEVNGTPSCTVARFWECYGFPLL